MSERHYTIEKPPFQLQPTSRHLLADDEATRKIVVRAQLDYLSWQEFKRKSWATDRKEEIWNTVQFLRQISQERTSIKDEAGQTYVFNSRSHVQFLHEVDLELGGAFLGVQDFRDADKRQIIRRNLIEESIASSKLEGANTSRLVARKMLTEGRAPRDKSEQMIVNNHDSMKWIEEELKGTELSLDLIYDIHSMITDSTIDAEHQGKLRDTNDENGNRLVIKPWDDRTIAYVTPTREFVEEQLPRFVAFANDRDGSGFVHPLVKAIMLHFWIGLLHPFEDGNGRLARIMFYWYMLRRGYWAFSYLSISERILKSPKQYAMAYIFTEQDGADLNYFIQYNIKKIKLAQQAFRDYLEEKIQENRQVSDIIERELDLNSRQIALIQRLVKDSQNYTTLKEHLNVNEPISKATAATDLRKLVEMALLEKKKQGRNVFFFPTPKVGKLLGG